MKMIKLAANPNMHTDEFLHSYIVKMMSYLIKMDMDELKIF